MAIEKIKIISRHGGRPKKVKPKLAHALVSMGMFSYADVQPAEKTPALDELGMVELRALAKRRGVEVEGRKKADFVKALRSYNRRDMRAED